MITATRFQGADWLKKRFRYTRLCLTVLCAMLIGVTACTDEPPPVQKLDPNVSGPSQVEFGEVNVGTKKPMTFTIDNVGAANLTIESVGLATGGSSANGQNFFELIEPPAAGTVVPAGQKVTVTVKFWAYKHETTGTTDSLVVRSNDPDTVELNVALNAKVVKPQLKVSPEVLSYDDVETGTSATLPLTLQNSGDGELQIIQIEFDTESEDELEVIYPEEFQEGDSIRQGTSYTLQVVYTPQEGSVDGGIVIISSNDSVTPRKEVPVTANGFTDLPPQAEILSPEEGEAAYKGSTILLSGKVSDAGTRPEELLVVWSISGIGQVCAGVKPDANGDIECSAQLPTVGKPSITLSARDAKGQFGEDSVSIEVFDEETPLAYVISGSDEYSTHAFEADDDIRVWLIDGDNPIIDEDVNTLCVNDYDGVDGSTSPKTCKAKYGDYLRVVVYDRFGSGGGWPNLTLWYADEWSQPIIPDAFSHYGEVLAAEPYNIPCEPMPTKKAWLEAGNPEGSYPDACPIYDNAGIVAPYPGDMLVKITIPPQEVSDETR